MLERVYQARLIKEIEKRFIGCVVIKLDPDRMQGVLDLLILWEDKWAMLEVKASRNARRRPNQPYYVALFNKMSFADFIYPENEEEILNALQQSFESERNSRVP